MTEYVGLGDVFKAVRERSKLSQDELAAKVGTHRNIIYRVEKNPKRHRLDLLIRIAEAQGEDFWKMLRFSQKGAISPVPVKLENRN